MCERLAPEGNACRPPISLTRNTPKPSPLRPNKGSIFLHRTRRAGDATAGHRFRSCLPQTMRGHSSKSRGAGSQSRLHQRLHRLFRHRLANVGPQPTRGLPCFLAMRAGSARYQRRILPSVPRLQSNGTRPNGTGTCASIYPHEEQIREPSVVTIFPSDRGRCTTNNCHAAFWERRIMGRNTCCPAFDCC